MNFHGLKDIVMIYSSDQNGKPDYTWDKAKVKVWNPEEQREMELVFTGSSKGDTPETHEINFNVIYHDRGLVVFDAFDSALKKIFPNISDELLNEYRKTFLKELIAKRQN